MSTALLEKVIQEIKLLAPAEQIKVRELLDDILPSAKKPPSREEYEKYLLAKGVISHIPTRQPPSPERQAFRPIKVEGQPISETIIEERR